MDAGGVGEALDEAVLARCDAHRLARSRRLHRLRNRLVICGGGGRGWAALREAAGRPAGVWSWQRRITDAASMLVEVLQGVLNLGERQGAW